MNAPRLPITSRILPQPRVAFLASLAAALAGTASAASYQWTGAVSSDWNDPANWTVAGIAPTNGTYAHRLNINHAAGFEAIYTADQGTTVYAPVERGLVIGSGALGSGTFRITGGKFSSVGATSNDVIANTGSNTGRLIIDGGEYETSLPLLFGNSGGVLSYLQVNSGLATIGDLTANNLAGEIILNGGTLAMNRIIQAGGGSTFITFDGGTLKARMSTTAFFPTSTGPLALGLVQDGGATFDTNGFDITFGNTMMEDDTQPGGGLTKNGAGTLTFTQPITVKGPVNVNGGGLGITADALSWKPASFTHSGTTFNINLGVYSPLNEAVIDVPTLTLNSTGIVVNISGSSIPVSSEIRLIDYGTKSGTGSLVLNVASLPTNMVATLEENTVDGYYYLRVTSPSASTYNWSGLSSTPGSGIWDTSSLSWNSGTAAYAEPAFANFPTITGGSTVNIAADVAPLSVSINNTSGNTYTFGGTGRIGGATGITKSGTGIAIFDGAAHTYAGTLTVSQGAVIKRKADDTTGMIVVSGDDRSFVLSGGITDGAGQTLSLSGRGALTGGYFFTGSAVQRGALQSHNGANTWAGDILVAGNDFNNPTRVGVQAGASLTLTGNITESSPATALLFRAAGVGENINLAGSGIYSYTGRSLIFSTGASIILGATNKLPIGTGVVMDSGGATILDLNGFNQQVSTLSGSASHTTNPNSARILNSNASTPSILTIAPAVGVSGYFMGSISAGAGLLSVVKSGEGTQILASANTYTGTTTIEQGRLEVGGGGGAGSLSPSSQIINNALLVFNRTNTHTQGTDFANDITGSGRIIKVNTGTLVLTSANTYLGSTTVNSGTLSLSGAGTVGAGQVVLQTGTTFDVSAATPATVSLTGGLAGTGSVNATGKTLSIGGSYAPTALTITGNVALSPSTTTTLVAGSAPASTSQTTVTGTFANQGALAIAAATDVLFADGQSYVFFTVSGGITAGFSSVSVGSMALSSTEAGVWSGSAGGLKYTYTETTGTLAVVTAPPEFTALESWRILYFGSAENSGNGADDFDFDNDGSSNLLEYALGTIPTEANASGIVVDRVGNVLTLTYTRRTPADTTLTYTVLASSDLAAGFTAAPGTTLDLGSTSVYTDTVDLSAPGTRRFLRLSVTRAP